MSNERNRPPRPHGPMGHGPGPRVGEKAKDFGGTMKKLIRYISRYKIAVILVMLFAVAGTALNIAGPKVLIQATQAIVDGVVRMISGTGGIGFGLWAGLS